MTRIPVIWSCLKCNLQRNVWIDIQDIYKLVQKNVSLDQEDYIAQSPSSDIPKWMRNVRNVLQYRKTKGEIDWDGQGKYRIR